MSKPVIDQYLDDLQKYSMDDGPIYNLDEAKKNYRKLYPYEYDETYFDQQYREKIEPLDPCTRCKVSLERQSCQEFASIFTSNQIGETGVTYGDLTLIFLVIIPLSIFISTIGYFSIVKRFKIP